MKQTGKANHEPAAKLWIPEFLMATSLRDCNPDKQRNCMNMAGHQRRLTLCRGNHGYENKHSAAKRVHASRVTGCHCDYRPPGGAIAASAGQVQVESAPHRVPEQPQADWPCLHDLGERARREISFHG